MLVNIGVLALQGSVREHMGATANASASIGTKCSLSEVRTKEGLGGLHGLIIPGGESTVLQKLCEREGMMDAMRKIPCIFGTCAGAIMLAKDVGNREADQRTLGLMDIGIDRNGYGRQVDSFEEDVESGMGAIHAVFIRAPRIRSLGAGVRPLASIRG
jgi:5'-phosphate synthase pdxT subunit